MIKKVAHVRLVDHRPALFEQHLLVDVALADQRMAGAGPDVGMEIEHRLHRQVIGQDHVGKIGKDHIEPAVAQRFDEFFEKALA